jgi:ComF family protein
MPLRTLLSLVAPPLCVACGAGAGRVEPLCSRCRSELRPAGAEPGPGGLPVYAAFSYEGGAGALVRALKFRGATGAAATMAAQLTANVPVEWLAGRALVPVPMHAARRRRRGFNQAELLARRLAERCGCELSDCLERVGPRGTQVGRGRAERLDRAGPTVRVRPGASVPARAVVIDDVVTTGATLAACAAVLEGAGAAEVAAVTYARTLGR